MVDGATASMAWGVVHHSICSTHWIVQLSNATTACIAINCQVLLQRRATDIKSRREGQVRRRRGKKKKGRREEELGKECIKYCSLLAQFQ